MRGAAALGTALADTFVDDMQSAQAAGTGGCTSPALGSQLRTLLQRVPNEVRSLSLSISLRARIADSFKSRLLDKGMERELVDGLTHALLLRLTTLRPELAPHQPPGAPGKEPTDYDAPDALMVRAEKQGARGAYAEAMESYEAVLTVDPRNVVARNNLGVALARLGRCAAASEQYRRAIRLKECFFDAHFNLGNLLGSQGRFADSEQPLRRALKLRPKSPDVQVSLATTLINLGRLNEVRSLLEAALESTPHHAGALQILGDLRAREGQFAEAEALYKSALEVTPHASHAWAGLAALRRMTSADTSWYTGAQRCAGGGLPPLEEAEVRYSIGKYHDDVGEYELAFRSYRRANELVKSLAEAYEKDARQCFVDDLIRTYPRKVLAHRSPEASESAVPVLVVGMPRSGTTLVDQIIASHPAVKSAGELGFWPHAVATDITGLRHEPPNESLRRRLWQKYLRTLTERRAKALRITDKCPFNSDHLGIIHTVFPRARVVYVQRDPIDTCLSCYFQSFPPTLNFTLDLSDLVHYFREHRRLVEHWRTALPQGVMLTVSYEGLIADQEGWTRRIVEFLGLPWDDRCLNYQGNVGTVLTASYWQVRQKLYESSMGRWHHYEKLVEPLLELRDLD